MKMRLKALAVFTVICMLSALFTGCAKEPDNAVTEGESTSQTDTPTENIGENEQPENDKTEDENDSMAENNTTGSEIAEEDASACFDGNPETVFRPGDNKNFTFTVDFGNTTAFNTVTFRKTAYIKALDMYSENSFRVEAYENGEWREIYGADELVSERTAAVGDVVAEKVKFTFFTEGSVESIGDISFDNIEKTVYEKQFRNMSYLRCNSPVDWDALSGHLEIMTDFIMIDVCSGFSSDGHILSLNEELSDYVSQAKSAIGDRDIKLWFCIGNCKDISDETLATQEAIDSLVAECAELCNEYDFYGINIDYEYPSSSKQWSSYSKFIVALSSALSQDGRFVSAAMAPWGLSITKAAKEALEHVDIMAYDLFDSLRRHSSYTTASDAVGKALSAGFKPEQIILGLSFYGREIDTDTEERWWGYNTFTDKYDISRSTNFADGSYFSGWYLNRDKALLAIQNNLGGVFSWHLRCDLPIDNELSLTAAVASAAECYTVTQKSEND